jgi:hypothetical protein
VLCSMCVPFNMTASPCASLCLSQAVTHTRWHRGTWCMYACRATVSALNLLQWYSNIGQCVLDADNMSPVTDSSGKVYPAAGKICTGGSAWLQMPDGFRHSCQLCRAGCDDKKQHDSSAVPWQPLAVAWLLNTVVSSDPRKPMPCSHWPRVPERLFAAAMLALLTSSHAIPLLLQAGTRMPTSFTRHCWVMSPAT